MAEATVSVFFYGSFINLSVLGEVDVTPINVEVAFLRGFDIRIQPLANLVRSEGDSVYGILCETTHAGLDRLYGQDWVVLSYRPEAVLAETVSGRTAPALCYIAPSSGASAAAADYIDRIVDPARELGFPGWYIERIERFRHGPLP